MSWGGFSRVLCADSKSVVRLSLSPLVHEVSPFEILRNMCENKQYINMYIINIHNQIMTNTN